MSKIGDNQQGTVGGPLKSTKVKISDSGEICLSGPNLANSYFKGTMEGDLISTGDLGEILPNGAIKVIDRVENVFKLTQGEQIHPLKLEHVYM